MMLETGMSFSLTKSRRICRRWFASLAIPKTDDHIVFLFIFACRSQP